MAMDIFRFQSGAFPNSTKLVGFRGSEALSELFRFEIFLTVPSDEDLTPEDAVWSKASLTIDRGGMEETLCGILEAVELLHEANGRALFRVDLVPRLSQLALAEKSRIFTGKKVPEILTAVLEDAGLSGQDVEARLGSGYGVEEHICQYKETDLAFLSRWMEREGIYYFFAQDGERDKLVLVDDPSRHERMPEEALRYSAEASADASARDALRIFACKRRALSSRVELSDHDYMKPQLAVSGAADVKDGLSGEVREHGARFFTPEEGKRLARLRAEEKGAAGEVFRGEGRVFHLRPGYRFSVDEHPVPWMNGEYLCTELIHVGNLGATTAELRRMTGIDIDEVYRVEVKALRAGVPFRPPRRTPWPAVHGPEIAVVDGPGGGDYAQLDDAGRYLVRFNFDESGLPDGKASTRVRMMQPHAGNPEGFHFPLRKGTEVLVFFVGGDPDRPVIGGAVPNAETPSPVTSANNTKNVIHTGGNSRIEIEDQDGKQWIDISTPPKNTYLHLGEPHPPHTHYIEAHTDGNCLFEIGSNQDIDVGGNLTETVKGPVVERYSTSQTSRITGPQTTIVDSAVTEKYGGPQTTTVGGPVMEIYAATQDTDVSSKGRKETFSAGQITLVTGNVGENYTGKQHKTVTGPTVQNMASLGTFITGTLTQTFSSAVTQIWGPVDAQMASLKWEIPGGATIFTPKFDVQIPSDWLDFLSYDEVVSTKLDVVGLTTAIFGFKAEYQGVSIGGATVKREAHGAQITNTVCDIGVSAEEEEEGGPSLIAYALYVVA
jgi:type VI secretion system secreted protein VgrG